MKAKYAVIIFVIGFSFYIIGALMKIMHWPFAGLVITIATITELVGIILFLCKLFTYPKFKEFLNW